MYNEIVMEISLNTEQKKAVDYEGGPILIVAGAGTGKTRVITERIKWLIENKKARPCEILSLTFTEKAAAEMLDRVDVAMPLGYEEPWLSTFHSFAERILREEGLEIGLDTSYKILTPPQAWLFVRQNLFEFDLKYYRPLGNPTKFISAMLTLFSRAQDEDTSPADFVRWAKLKSQKSKVKTDGERETAEKYLELAKAYETYQNLKIENSFMDFGDLISWTLKLFRERATVLKKYQEQFKYILLDEFQDTNYAQYQLIKLLAPNENNPELMVVGDDDQSIYKFRGAAVSNILEFKKDYPSAETIVLTKNYRSGQKILNAVYQLIQNNNPDRLEEKLGIEKKLTRDRRQETGDKNVGPEVIHTAMGEGEAEEVVRKITELKKDFDWRDFAILARANNHLDPFVAALKRYGIPYQLIGNRGLFDQEEVRDVIAILRVLADPEDSVSLYRLLNLDVLKIEPQKIAAWLNLARGKRQSLWEILKTVETRLIASLPIEKYRKEIAKKPVTLLAFNFLDEIGYVRPLLEEESIENQLKIKNLNLFFDKIKEFESEAPEPNVIEFVNYLDLMIEAGESPAQAEIEDIDTVNLLTVHAAKGLEFPVVFLVNLVSDRFPTRNRKDKLPLPDALVKETLPEGNAHIQEERRLFYVGCTRAKEKLFLTWAGSYGGKRPKKSSGFIRELGIKNQESRIKGEEKQLGLLLFQPETQPSYQLPRPPRYAKRCGQAVTSHPPKYVSYSQLETFSQCPLKYKYRYVLRLPTPPSHTLSFGQTIHRTLRDFHRSEVLRINATGGRSDISRLLELYEHHWLAEGYESKEHQQKRFEEGKEILKEYFEKHKKLLGEPVQLEKKFTLKVGGIPLIGSIDRVDKLPGGGFEIVDYKTGKVREKKYVDRDDQLTIYALGAKAALGIEPQSLALYFVNENKKVSTTRTPEQLEKKRQEIEEKIEEIKESQFEPKTSRLCKWCPYQNLCPDYKQNLF